MWIEQLPNGKYKYVERYEDPLTGKVKKVSLTHIKKNNRVEKEMFMKLQDKIEKKLDLKDVDSKITLRELSDKWLKVYSENAKLSSVSRTKGSLNTLNEVLGDVQVSKIKASHINNYFLNKMNARELVYSSASQLKSNVSRVLKHGQTYHGLYTENIIKAIEIPKINITEKDEYNYLERNELNKIVETFTQSNDLELKRMVVFQASTGMRYGEMASLDYKTDIDFSDQSISINKTYDFRNKIFTSPKSGDDRIIYFNKDIAKLLREQIYYTQLLTMSRGLPKENTQLFKTPFGNVIQHRKVNSKLKKVELDKRVRTHTLRHTFVSLAVEKGISKDLIAKQVGHSDTKMIEVIYSHFTKGMQKQQKEAMLDFKII
ncbi:hypothetical protein BKP56_06935 [Marinilactibacillus sp. 15R]|uniref:tyrosine-type recombinase/integrase n=1 Tax=Marinilactibacillus sp. 15R TaxID=1911586 RepID=UPI00090C1395|nr:site-specific integrase [Marinilactibacillus sp. 15R]API89004.1 hypothetical protein BKP56_06935 [Marinilactibacillus sp. 15R]